MISSSFTLGAARIYEPFADLPNIISSLVACPGDVMPKVEVGEGCGGGSDYLGRPIPSVQPGHDSLAAVHHLHSHIRKLIRVALAPRESFRRVYILCLWFVHWI